LTCACPSAGDVAGDGDSSAVDWNSYTSASKRVSIKLSPATVQAISSSRTSCTPMTVANRSAYLYAPPPVARMSRTPPGPSPPQPSSPPPPPSPAPPPPPPSAAASPGRPLGGTAGRPIPSSGLAPTPSPGEWARPQWAPRKRTHSSMVAVSNVKKWRVPRSSGTCTARREAVARPPGVSSSISRGGGGSQPPPSWPSPSASPPPSAPPPLPTPPPPLLPQPAPLSRPPPPPPPPPPGAAHGLAGGT